MKFTAIFRAQNSVSDLLHKIVGIGNAIFTRPVVVLRNFLVFGWVASSFRSLLLEKNSVTTVF